MITAFELSFSRWSGSFAQLKKGSTQHLPSKSEHLIFLAHIYWSVPQGKTKHTRCRFSNLPLYEFSSLSPCSEYNICKVASRWPRWVRDRQDMRLSPQKGPLTTNPFHCTGHNTLHFSTLREDGSPKKGRLPPPSLRPPTHATDSLGQTCTILGPKITVIYYLPKRSR